MTDQILIVDDESAIRFALRVLLEDAGHTVIEAEDGMAALAVLEQNPDTALVISDLRMPRLDGHGLIAALAERRHAPPVVVITAHGSERTAVEAMKAGALDYFAKPFREDELLRVVQRNLKTARLSMQVRSLSAVNALRRHMVFESPAMVRLAERVQRIARRDLPVLITGESGTGKELVGRAIVAGSARAERPYLPFNCAAVGAELAEAELFGHAKGAFTGAERARKGLFREADGGTVLLDEVGELRPSAQAALLRTLQEGTVRPVGRDRALPVDVRVLAATHRDLPSLSAFRDDLYFRLHVLSVHIPPLRERPRDIVPLARHFARGAADRFGQEPLRLTGELEAWLERQPWKGNVRELEHLIHRLVALADPPTLGLDDLEAGVAASASSSAGEPGLKARVDAFERQLIAAALAECGGNQSETARRLKVSRMTLVTKLKKHGLR